MTTLRACATLALAAAARAQSTPAWAYVADSPLLSAAALSSTTAFVLATSGAVTAVDLSTGTPQWVVAMNTSGEVLTVPPFYHAAADIVFVTTPTALYARACRRHAPPPSLCTGISQSDLNRPPPPPTQSMRQMAR